MIIKYIFKNKIPVIIIYMDETISTIEEKVPKLTSLSEEELKCIDEDLYNYANFDDDDDQEDEIINFDEFKNDELVRLKCVSHSAKLEEIFKRIQESKTPQFFECKECYEMWGCSWCGHGFCDDIMSPYILEGKPEFWSINNIDPEYLKSMTEKQKRKMIKKYEEEPPTLKRFFLCKWCKNKYIDKNISKGRHSEKIGRRLDTF